ncbi:hypothetical protein [Kocuria sp. TGY1127_2]|uniref:hypothetical protein n=1 Tax=Kocuria sp. TGY1127_2 TaxID=2711328 RepID=UPI0015C125E9|nr:hypothetical protein [Kocuria sp. TGY1127_2]
MTETPLDPQVSRPLRIPWKAAAMARLRLINRFSSAAVLGEAPVAVNMTSYGHRLPTVWLAIESIAQGRVKPQRMILWVDDEAFDVKNYPQLLRLQHRGLEILRCEDLGPYKKFYPYIRMTEAKENPPVIADDDIMYPAGWLGRLYGAHQQYPEEMVALRCHQWTLADGGNTVAPYSAWSAPHGFNASFSNFMTGAGGAVLPRALQERILRDGKDFMKTCPRADDIWINVEALRAGVRTRFVSSKGLTYISIPGLQQKSSLHSTNVAENGNDAQIRATLTSEDIRILAGEAPVID